MEHQIFYAVLLLLDLFVLLVVLSGAPYVPTSHATVDQMVKLALEKNPRTTADIGAGDGRIVIALARKGIEAHGYEINPALVWLARRNIRKAGLEGKAKIFLKDLWRVDFGSYDVVTVFGITQIMQKLEQKLRRELRPGARVVSHIFRFPNWECLKRNGEVHVYEKPISTDQAR
ncbi:class I SAM-dependent methyltransferase [Candidatus Uhrbacteria bacterium]|nr:class I SAM-dependent methyltransferase [Candidatus Uhrbacteria bacterium]